MREERVRILELLQAGKITVEEAEQLLDALGPAGEQAAPSGEAAPAPPQAGSRRLCIRITDLRSGKQKVNVRLPAGAWSLLSKLTRTSLGRRLSGQALYEIQRAARSGSTGHIVDLSNDERGERVEIFFEER